MKTFGFFRNLLPRGQAVAPLNLFINVNSVTSIDIPTANVAYGVRFLMTSNLVSNQTIYYDVVGANANEMFDGSLTGTTTFQPNGDGNVTVYIKPSSNIASNANIVINLRAGSADAQPFYSQNAVIENHTNIVATGGTITTLANGDKLHAFTTVGNTTFTQSAGNAFLQYLLVAGGGAGGTTNLTGDTLYSGAGGGGAGGVLAANIIQTPITSNVSVGARGTIRTPGSGAEQGNPGGNTSALGFTAIGGGGGGRGGSGDTDSVRGGSGGSGGGGGASIGTLDRFIPGGTGVTGQGFAGGQGYTNRAVSPSLGAGGGGGGAGQVGSTADGSVPGGGGNGIQSSITDTALYYAGGGAGVSHLGTSTRTGGLGGGGNSNSSATFYGGGGGGNGNGYQGVAYLRYGPYGKKLVLT